MKKIIFSAIFMGALLEGCPPSPVPAHNTPVPTDTALCPTADQHLTQLCKADPVKNKYCCDVVAPTKKGKNFTQVCIEKQNEGLFLNPRCLAQVTSCDQIDVCTKTK